MGEPSLLEECTLTTRSILTRPHMVHFIMESMFTTLLSSYPLWPTITATSKKSRTILCLCHLRLLMMLRNSMFQALLTQKRKAKISLSIRARKVTKVTKARKAKRKMMLRTS